MQIEQVQRKVEMEGFDQPETKFSIESSPLAFKILSDNLYSDKPLAVVRELGCNAFDAHVAAGNELTPFDVHLPNTFEPFFSIRDYGTGMSDADVKGLYTTYFDSTKRNTNKAVGMLGLGSKSPFSYVDQFNITSYFNGTRSIYVAYINPQGVPSLRSVASEPTDEPNGLEIEMGVNPDDFYVFADRARKVFHRFPVLPNLKGNRDADLTQVKYTLTGPNYKVRSYDERYQYGEHRGAYAVQGVVAYPINLSRISIEMTSKEQSLVKDLPIDIIFNIGELDIVPSREELSYDPVTQANIVKKVREVLAHIPSHAKTVLADQKTLWDAKKTWARWRNDNQGEARFMKQVLDESLDWGGIKINNDRVKLKMYDEAAEKANSKLITSAPLGVKPTLLPVADYGDIAVMESKDLDSDKRPKAAYYREIDIKASEDTIIVWVDDAKIGRSIARYVQHAYADQEKTVYCIRPIAGHEQAIKDQLGGFTDFVLASTLQEPPPPAKNATTVVKDIRKLYKVNRFNEWNGFDKEETTHDVSNGGIYIVTYNGKIISPGDEWLDADTTRVPATDDSQVKILLHYAEQLGLIKGPVYAFNSTHKSLIKKHAGWENIFDVLKREIIAKSKDKGFLKQLNQVVAYAECANANTTLKKAFESFNHMYAIIPHVTNPKSRFINLMEQIKTIGTEAQDFLKLQCDREVKLLNSTYQSGHYTNPDVQDIIKTFDVAHVLFKTHLPDFSKPKKQAANILQMFRTYYPLLGAAVQNVYNLQTEKEAIALYINLCDKGAGLMKDFNKPKLQLKGNDNDNS